MSGSPQGRLPRERKADQTISDTSFHESLERLYESTSWTVVQTYGESYEMDRLLMGLRKPAHQALFVIQNAIESSGSIAMALNHCQHLLKPQHCYILAAIYSTRETQKPEGDNNTFLPCLSYTVVPRGSKVPDGWKHLLTEAPANNHNDDTVNDSNMHRSKQLVSQIVGVLVTSQQPEILLQKLREHLCYTLGTDLRNGAAAEVAFDLSLAGVEMEDLYSRLAHVAALELQRKSARALHPASILQVVEKLAASGLRNDNPFAAKAYRAAYQYLVNIKQGYTVLPETLEQLKTGQLHLTSSKPLIWLWRRGHLFHKVSTQDTETSLSLDTLISLRVLKTLFSDPTRPLVLDVGCGLGVSLLGLATGKPTTSSAKQFLQPVDWSQFNYLGGELSSQAVRWANAMAARWQISDRCRFLQVSTETLLDYLNWEQTQRHPSPQVAWILLQFPTPYRLHGEHVDDDQEFSGNNRLPRHVTDDAFMANPRVLQRMVNLLNGSDNIGATRRLDSGHLLVQSNCEDVALYIYDTLRCMGMHAVASHEPRQVIKGGSETARTKAWFEQQCQSAYETSAIRRASGDHWSSQPILPVSTETEAACQLRTTPIHRCLFRTNEHISYSYAPSCLLDTGSTNSS
jgi:hypothetical protein